MREFPELPITSQWVERTLASLTLDQKIGQLLHPCVRPAASDDERIEALGGIEPGGMFLFSGRREEFLGVTRWLQERSPVPLIVSSDLENGAGHMILDATIFPDTMALGATGSEELAFEMGRATAVEGRAHGVHWSFGPVVDINANPHNPGTNTISLGDDPDLVARLSRAMIRGMQQHGLCATAKHFPGGGFDDRDQHICNTINPLRMDQWFALSGRTFQETIDLGVWSIMVGHISLPAWDPGDGKHVQTAPPATLSCRIVTDLLRGRMGFRGVVVTDAMNMGGVTSFGPREKIVPAAIEAGCDMILFAEARRDFDILKRAVEDGRLAEARVEESARRILALKEMLGLHEDRAPRPSPPADGEHFRRVSREIAERAITLVRDRNGALPLKLEQGTRVLSYHVRGDPAHNVDRFDDLLRARGVEVTRFDETDLGKLPDHDGIAGFDAVLISAVFGTSWGTNRIRPAGNYMRDVWSVITSRHPRLALVSYGSPYLVYDLPHLPLVINAYSPDGNTQEAVLRVLTGEIAPTGKSPVNLEGPYLFKSLEGLRYLR